MSRINGEKARSHVDNRRRTEQRALARLRRAEFLASKSAAASKPAEPVAKAAPARPAKAAPERPQEPTAAAPKRPRAKATKTPSE